MTQIKLVVSIFGDLLDSKILNDIIGLTPTNCWNKGDLIPNRKNGLVRKETCNEYSFGFMQTLLFEKISSQFIEIIKPNLELLANYINEKKLESKIYIVVKIFNNEIPGLYFDKEFTQTVVKMNGEIDIDLYFLEN